MELHRGNKLIKVRETANIETIEAASKEARARCNGDTSE